MPKKIYALIPSEREKDCDHSYARHWSGGIPLTGKLICNMCGSVVEKQRDILPTIPDWEWHQKKAINEYQNSAYYRL